MRSLRAVLFDAAGTLIRLQEPVGDTYARSFAAQGATIPASRLEEAFARVLRGMPPMVFPGVPAALVAGRERAWWRQLVRRTLRAADGSVRPRDFEACFDALFLHFGSADAWHVMPGTEQALETLAARGLRLAVVSNFDQRLRGLLAELGLAGRFERIVLPADAAAAKPDPRIFSVALEGLALLPSEAIYVDDDPLADHAAARSAGLRAVDVRGLATLASLPDLISAQERHA